MVRTKWLLVLMMACDVQADVRPTVSTPDPEPVDASVILPVEDLPADQFNGTKELWDEERQVMLIEEAAVNLGFGEDYIDEMRLTPVPNWLGCHELDTWDIKEVVVSDEGVVDVWVDDFGDIAVRALGPGMVRVKLGGLFTTKYTCRTHPVPAGTPVVTEQELVVRVVEPSGFGVQDYMWCEQSMILDTPMTEVAIVHALDEQGEPVWISNATQRGQVPLRLTPPEGGAVQVLDGRRVAFSGVAGQATIDAFGSAPHAVQVRPIGDISSVEEVHFDMFDELGWAYTVQEGGVYDGEELSRPMQTDIHPIVGRAQIGGEELCERPHASWFEVHTADESVCTAVETDLGGWQWTVNGAVRVVDDGVCTMTLSAPGFADGRGFETSVSATFANTQMMVQP